MTDGDGTDDAQPVPPMEKVVMAVSVLFTALLFGFAAWQAVTGPGVAAPEVGVIDQQTAPDGDVVVTVELRNPGDVGLVRATVVARCDDPPIRLLFESVPSGGRRVGTIACPPGTLDPGVSVETWVHQ